MPGVPSDYATSSASSFATGEKPKNDILAELKTLDVIKTVSKSKKCRLWVTSMRAEYKRPHCLRPGDHHTVTGYDLSERDIDNITRTMLLKGANMWNKQPSNFNCNVTEAEEKSVADVVNPSEVGVRHSTMCVSFTQSSDAALIRKIDTGTPLLSPLPPPPTLQLPPSPPPPSPRPPVSSLPSNHHNRRQGTSTPFRAHSQPTRTRRPSCQSVEQCSHINKKWRMIRLRQLHSCAKRRKFK